MAKQTSTTSINKSESARQICTCCGKDSLIGEFYESKSELYKNIERLSICKNCITNIFQKIIDQYNEKEAIYRLCRKLDVPFHSSAYEAAVSHSKKTGWKIHQSYFTKLNSLRTSNNYGNDFDDAEKLMEDALIDNSLSDEIPEDIKIFWGKGLSPDDYEYLETERPHWFDRYKCDTRGEEILYKQICYQLLDIKKAREENKDVAKMLDTLHKLMESANVKPKDANALSDSDNIDTYGVRIRDIELYDPAEYFEDRNLYRDFSGIETYFKKWITRPFKNLLKGTRDFEVGEDD